MMFVIHVVIVFGSRESFWQTVARHHFGRGPGGGGVVGLDLPCMAPDSRIRCTVSVKKLQITVALG